MLEYNRCIGEEMKTITITLLLIALVFISGCSSYDDCKSTCYKVNEEMKGEDCGAWGHICLDTIPSELTTLCHNECKPK